MDQAARLANDVNRRLRVNSLPLTRCNRLLCGRTDQRASADRLLTIILPESPEAVSAAQAQALWSVDWTSRILRFSSANGKSKQNCRSIPQALYSYS